MRERLPSSPGARALAVGSSTSRTLAISQIVQSPTLTLGHCKLQDSARKLVLVPIITDRKTRAFQPYDSARGKRDSCFVYMYQAQHEPLVAGCCAERRLHMIRSIVLDFQPEGREWWSCAPATGGSGKWALTPLQPHFYTRIVHSRMRCAERRRFAKRLENALEVGQLLC
jgi:hypothetical protein